jgi:hypothetical protein
MTAPEHDDTSFIEALRSDLPDADADARVRARLFAAGIGVAAGLSATGAAGAHGAATGAKVGVLSKLAALPLAAKVGAASLVIAASAVPVVSVVTSEAPQAAEMVASPRGAATPPARTLAALPGATPALWPEQAEEPEALDQDPAGVAEPGAAARAARRLAPAPRSEPTLARDPAPEDPAPRAGSVASFPVPAAQTPEGTLRAETALIEGALSAIRAGDRARAARLLDEHRRGYPNGLLIRERERALERLRSATLVESRRPAR